MLNAMLPNSRDMIALFLALIGLSFWWLADVFGHELLTQIAILAILAMSLDLPTPEAVATMTPAEFLKRSKKVAKNAKDFAKKVVKMLERNCLNVCNPHIDVQSRYPKINYRLPSEI